MKRILTLATLVVIVSCSGGKKGDDRIFGSLSASFDSYDGATAGSGDAIVGSDDTVILGDVDGTMIGNIGKGTTGTEGDGKGTTPPPATTPGKETPPAKTPDISDELKAKIAKCYPQWSKDTSGTAYDIRQINVDVDKLKKSNIQLTGTKPEIVFVNIAATGNIELVNLSLENAKGLYCLDISADKSIKKLDIAYICGAKLGLVDIEAGKAKKVNIHEVCDKP